MQHSTEYVSRRTMLKGVGAASVAGVAGCLGDDDEGEAVEIDDEVTIQFWEYFGGTEQDEINQLVDEFNDEHDNITVEMSNVPFDEFFDAIFTAVASEEAPHVTTYWMSFSNYMVEQGAIDPIDDFMEVSVDDYYDSAQPAMVVDDQVYSLPMDVHGLGMYANETVLEEAGINEVPQDWESFQSACETIDEETDARPAAWLPNNSGIDAMRAYFMALQQTDDPNLVEEDNGSWDVVYDQTDGGQEIAELLSDFTSTYGFDDPSVSDDEERISMFLDDELGFMFGGNWVVNDMQDEDGEIIEGLAFSFNKPYVFPGGNPGTFAESTGYFFPADPSHTDEERTAAVRFAEWVTTNNPLWAQTAGHLPAAVEVGESEEVTTAEYYEDLGIVSTIKEMADAGEMVQHPLLPVDIYETGIANPLVDIYAQNAEPDEALQSSADTLRDRLS